jgi:hypothetical protein
MSMGVRVPDKERKEKLDELIISNTDKIQAILVSHQVPLVDKDGKPIPAKSGK